MELNYLRKKLLRKLFFLSLLISFSPLSSQEKISTDITKYARSIVDTMSSEAMHGRGYVNEGDKIAAKFIDNEFKKDNLNSFGDTYFQKFKFPINTFPGEVKIIVDGRELTIGKDYILEGLSGSLKGDFDIIHFNDGILKSKKSRKRFIKTDFSGKVIIIDKANLNLKDKEILNLIDAFSINLFKAKAIVFIEDKLTAELATQQESYPIIKLLRTSFSGQEKKISISIENKFIPEYNSQNVIGYVEGSEFPDSFLVFSAHYDHLGQMGNAVYFPGANDNASGCAMLLNLAKYYSQAENKPKYSIAFMAFGAEEVGLLGSKYYTEHPLFPLSKIKFLLNMDIMGTGEEGITVVNGSVFKKEYNILVQINEKKHFLEAVKSRGKAAISDHYFFTEKGVHSFFIYTMGGIKAYHDIFDKSETLPLNEMENLFQLLIDFAEHLQQ